MTFRLPQIKEGEVASLLGKLKNPNCDRNADGLKFDNLLERVKELDPILTSYILQCHYKDGDYQYGPKEGVERFIEFLSLLSFAGERRDVPSRTVPNLALDDLVDFIGFRDSEQSVDIYLSSFGYLVDMNEAMADADPELKAKAETRASSGDGISSVYLCWEMCLTYLMMKRAEESQRLENDVLGGAFRGAFTILKADQTDGEVRPYDDKLFNIRARHECGVDTILIGRAIDNDLVLDNPTVSRRHCQIILGNGLYELKDTSSSGTTVADVNGIELNYQDTIPLEAVGELFLGGDCIHFTLNPLQPPSKN